MHFFFVVMVVIVITLVELARTVAMMDRVDCENSDADYQGGDDG